MDQAREDLKKVGRRNLYIAFCCWVLAVFMPLATLQQKDDNNALSEKLKAAEKKCSDMAAEMDVVQKDLGSCPFVLRSLLFSYQLVFASYYD